MHNDSSPFPQLHPPGLNRNAQDEKNSYQSMECTQELEKECFDSICFLTGIVLFRLTSLIVTLVCFLIVSTMQT